MGKTLLCERPLKKLEKKGGPFSQPRFCEKGKGGLNPLKEWNWKEFLT